MQRQALPSETGQCRGSLRLTRRAASLSENQSAQSWYCTILCSCFIPVIKLCSRHAAFTREHAPLEPCNYFTRSTVHSNLSAPDAMPIGPECAVAVEWRLKSDALRTGWVECCARGTAPLAAPQLLDSRGVHFGGPRKSMLGRAGTCCSVHVPHHPKRTALPLPQLSTAFCPPDSSAGVLPFLYILTRPLVEPCCGWMRLIALAIAADTCNHSTGANVPSAASNLLRFALT